MTRIHKTLPLWILFLFVSPLFAETDPETAPRNPIAVESPVAADDDAEKPVETNDFVFRFHRAVRDSRETPSNCVASPCGAAAIGEMLALGATGQTKEALETAFGVQSETGEAEIGNEKPDKNSRWLRLPRAEQSELPFVAVNGIWVQKGFPLLPTYIERLQMLYGPEIAEADFAGNAAAECRKINAWVAKTTGRRITSLFEDIDANTRLILANALVFQGNWDTPFNAADTVPADFHVAAEKTVEIPFLQKTGRFAYTENERCRLVELPYEMNRCSMLVVLPRENTTLDMLEQSLTLREIDELAEKAVLQPVRLALPKFEIESTVDMKDILASLGAGIVFDPENADFTAMNGSGGLYVGQALQKLYVRVDESGTEAAAATGAAVGLKSAPETGPEVPPKSFRADRPFLFLIRENTHGVPLFVGRFVAS